MPQESGVRLHGFKSGLIGIPGKAGGLHTAVTLEELRYKRFVIHYSQVSKKSVSLRYSCSRQGAETLCSLRG